MNLGISFCSSLKPGVCQRWWSLSQGCAEKCFTGWQLTRIDQFEPFPGVFRVAVKFQPEMVGSGDQCQSQHGGSRESSENVRCVVFTVINLKQQQRLLIKKSKYDGEMLPYTCFLFQKTITDRWRPQVEPWQTQTGCSTEPSEWLQGDNSCPNVHTLLKSDKMCKIWTQIWNQRRIASFQHPP